LKWLYGFSCVVKRNNPKKLKKLEWKIKNAVVRYGGVLCEFNVTRDYDNDGIKTFLGEKKKVLVEEEKWTIKFRETTLMQGYVGKELGHVVCLLGWQNGEEFTCLDSKGEKFGRTVGGRGGFAHIKTKAIYHIYIPQVQKWWDDEDDNGDKRKKKRVRLEEKEGEQSRIEKKRKTERYDKREDGLASVVDVDTIREKNN
jgi:hypothetical protein